MSEDQNQLAIWTEQDEIDLNYHERVIEKGLETFIEVGQSLSAIRDSRLYRKNFSTFEDYCQEILGRSRQWANRLIKSTEVVEQLENGANWHQKPTTESQARPLGKLETPEQRNEAWSKAVENSSTGNPTAKEVAAEVQKLKAQLEAAQRDNSQLKQLNEQANTAYRLELGNKNQAVATLQTYKQSEPERIAAAKAAAYEDAKKELDQEINALEASVSAKENELESLRKNPDPDMKAAIAKLEQEKRLTENELGQMRQRKLQAEQDLKALEDRTAEEMQARHRVQSFKNSALEFFEQHSGLSVMALPDSAMADLSEGLETLKNLLHHLERIGGDRPSKVVELYPPQAIDVEVN